MEKYNNFPLFHPSTFVMLWTCTFCRFRSKLDSYDVDNLSMLTGFFSIVLRFKVENDLEDTPAEWRNAIRL